jgi:hypothetical protein
MYLSPKQLDNNLRYNHKLMLKTLEMIIEKRNGVGWDKECCALLAEETIKKLEKI